MQTEASLNPADAAARMERHLVADPANTALRLAAVDAACAAGMLDRAAALVEDGLAAEPEHAGLRAKKGEIYLRRGAWSEAMDLFATLLKQHPHPALAYNYAYAALRSGAYDAAIERLLPYADAEDASPELVTLLLSALHHARRHPEALAIAARCEPRLAQSGAFLATYGLVAYDEGEAALAQRLNAAAMQAGAASPEAMVLGGSLALEAGDAEQADPMFSRAILANPDDGRSWFGLGMTSLLAQDFPLARQRLERAVNLMPEHIGSWHGLGWARLFDNDGAGAQAAFEHALGLDRNFGESHGALAVMAALRGDTVAADAALERAERLDTGNAGAQYARLLLAGKGRDPEFVRRAARRLLVRAGSPAAQRLGGDDNGNA